VHRLLNASRSIVPYAEVFPSIVDCNRANHKDVNMKIIIRALVPIVLLAVALASCGRKEAEEKAAAEAAAATAAAAREAMIADALSAASPALAASAKIVDWEGNVLREGSGNYTCMPTPKAMLQNKSPMCMDMPWMTWADAWTNHKEFSIQTVGISYMLAGDDGASNIDPYAKGETPDNQWIVEGPHVMIVVPDAKILDGLPTDPKNGGPYVMWKGTPYAHVMVPVNVPPQDAVETPVGDALSAANNAMTATVKVVDWKGKVLRDGSGAYMCMPTPPDLLGGRSPMCMDQTWMAWANAWSKHKPFKADSLGVSYMLAGDGGASNIDPYAKGETPDNQWIVEGAHLMIIVPEPSWLENLPTDPKNGGPYVMWKGTPYAHIMVPVAR